MQRSQIVLIGDGFTFILTQRRKERKEEQKKPPVPLRENSSGMGDEHRTSNVQHRILNGKSGKEDR